MKLTAGRAGALLCWLWLAVCTAYLGYRFSAKLPIDSDIQSMLPSGGADPVERAAMVQAGAAASGHIVFLVTGPISEVAGAAIDDLKSRLDATGLFAADTAEAGPTAAFVFANRNQLLCASRPEAFTPESARQIERRALAEVYSPTGAVAGDLLQRDPFLLTIRLAECLAPTSAARLEPTQRVLSGRLAASAFRIDAQDAIVGAVEGWRAAWSSKGVTVARAGAVFHAASAADRVKREVTLIGAIGGVGVIAIFLLAFLRASSTLWGVVLVYVGLAPGLAATMLVFGDIHMLVLVFAAMLIGVVSDYAVHTLATGPATTWAPTKERMHLVGRPITVSMATTALGFLALGIFGVRMFQQVAVLSAVGVASAWAFVLLVLIPIDRKPKHAGFYARWWSRLERARAAVAIPASIVWGSMLALAALSVWGAFHVRYLDDVRQFQPRSAQLQAEEDQIRAVGLGGSSVAFVLSRGATLDEARMAEEAALAQAPAEAVILASTRIDPSEARRRANAAVLKERLYAPLLAEHAAAIGLEPDEAEIFQPPPADIKRPDWLAELSGEANGGHYLVAPVLEGHGWTGPTSPGSVLIEPAERYSVAFRHYRGAAMLALGLAFIFASASVFAIYRRPAALTILIPPVLAAAAALLVQSALGFPLTFFSFAAALVMVGVGIDYAAFQWEAGESQDSWTATAVFIDAVTTLLSMGLLSLSETYPVRSFGLTVSIGIVAALCLSHIARVAAQKRGAR